MKENYEPIDSTTDESSVASHSSTSGNSMEQKKTLVISAFPGTGKTYLFRKLKDNGLSAIDSDSSQFSWINGTKIRNPEFPFNYIKHIKENIGKHDFIFVSSHKEVRTALIQYGVDFLSVYPEKCLKMEYIQRFKDRGNDDAFVDMMDRNWDAFIEGMEDLQVMQPLILKRGEYLSDYFMLYSDHNAQVSDTTDGDSSNQS